MSSDELFESEEQAGNENAAARKVRVVRKTRSVKVKVKAKDEEPSQNEKAGSTDETPAPRKRGRKPKALKMKANEDSTPDLFPSAENASPSGSALPPEAENGGVQPDEKTVEMPSDTAMQADAENPAETEAPVQASAQDGAAEASDESQSQNGADRKNRYSKFQKKGKKGDKVQKQSEPAVPDVNLDENPDAPKLFISDLTVLPLDTLRSLAREKGISEDTILDCRKQDLIREMAKLHAASGGALMTEGVLEVLSEGYGLIRYAVNSYIGGTEDVYVSHNMIKTCGLRTGDTVYGQVRSPRDNERFIAMIRVITVNGLSAQEAKLRVPFDSLTPLFPDEKLHLEYPSDPEHPENMDISTRVVDLFCPIGKGQRSLIVAPPRTGKTVLMQKIANAITTNHPEVKLIVLLVDERPEEVTDMRRNVKAEVVASTFDEQASRHVQVAEMVIEKAKRLVELHQDVVILLDSITRLARAYNQTVPASGKILSGGVDSNALHKPKRFFGAARNIENGGSLTIISTALIETGSRMDEVIFEEFKGTGNNEIVLDRRMADSRKFPAINLKKSGTRRDDLLLTKDELARLWLLRNAVSNMDDNDMSVFLIDKMRKTHNNKEFLSSMSASAVSSASFTASSYYK